MTILRSKTAATLCLVLVFPSMQIRADQQKEYEQSIQNIAREIKKIGQNLNANRALLKTEKDKLSVVEQEMIRIEKQRSKTKIKTENQKQANQKIVRQTQVLENTLTKDRQALKHLIRNRYENGEPNYIKMLLNQENPYAVGRLSNYLNYYSKALHEKLVTIKQQALNMKALKQQKESGLQRLQELLNQQQQEQQKLDQIKRARLKSINNLESKVSEDGVKIDRLQKDRKRLDRLLKQIKEQSKKLQLIEDQRQQKSKPSNEIRRPLVQGGFAKQKGRLQYPVEGKVEYRFGKRIAATGMKAQGIFFSTGGPQSVKSIYRGRVLFSGYLKGYGLLLIIDHGDDHISLYGHNEVLYKKVGDQIEINDVISKTGVSGGLRTHGLYFEIRENANPVDPAAWCR